VGAFGTVIVVVCLVAIVVAVLSFWGSGRIYHGLGRSGSLSMDGERSWPASAPPAGASSREAREEIRQMLEAKSARREARGERPLDVDAELAALTRPSQGRDDALREEVRQLVVARNERRLRQGKARLDLELEVERQLRDLGA
jgi:hypothetical protein